MSFDKILAPKEKEEEKEEEEVEEEVSACEPQSDWSTAEGRSQRLPLLTAFNEDNGASEDSLAFTR